MEGGLFDALVGEFTWRELFIREMGKVSHFLLSANWLKKYFLFLKLLGIF